VRIAEEKRGSRQGLGGGGDDGPDAPAARRDSAGKEGGAAGVAVIGGDGEGGQERIGVTDRGARVAGEQPVQGRGEGRLIGQAGEEQAEDAARAEDALEGGGGLRFIGQPEVVDPVAGLVGAGGAAAAPLLIPGYRRGAGAGHGVEHGEGGAEFRRLAGADMGHERIEPGIGRITDIAGDLLDALPGSGGNLPIITQRQGDRLP